MSVALKHHLPPIKATPTRANAMPTARLTRPSSSSTISFAKPTPPHMVSMSLSLRKVFMMSDVSDARAHALNTIGSREHVRAGLHNSRSLGSLTSLAEVPEGAAAPGSPPKPIGYIHPVRTASPYFAGVYLLPPKHTRSPATTPQRMAGDTGFPTARGAAGKKQQSKKEKVSTFKSSAEAAGRENEMLFEVADKDSDCKRPLTLD